MLNDAVISAWREAAGRLGLSIETAVTVELEPGRFETFEVLVRAFGHAAGTLVTTTDRMDLWDRSASTPHYCSAINPLHYSSYDEESFVEALRDWGWAGAGKPPDWMEDQPRS